MDEIWNSSFDNVDYGTERTTQTTITINPLVSDRYEDSMSENMEDVYFKKKMMNDMLNMYTESEFFKKYSNDYKKIERSDISDIYYYFKDKFIRQGDCNLVQIFCTIAEFFDFNYKTLYTDIISLEDKVKLLELLQEQYGLEREFSKASRLF